jgi:hypothetical protein
MHKIRGEEVGKGGGVGVSGRKGGQGKMRRCHDCAYITAECAEGAHCVSGQCMARHTHQRRSAGFLRTALPTAWGLQQQESYGRQCQQSS